MTLLATTVLTDLPPLPLWAWLAFFVFIAAMLALDLGVFHRGSNIVKTKEALIWCGVWSGLAFAFCGLLSVWRGGETAQQFLAGYLIELCLSVDNVFVFILVFAYFRVPQEWQHRVLFWGIIGAVVMRAIFILVGVSVLARFHWVIYIFGAFLIYTGVKMALAGNGEGDVDPEKNLAVRLFRRLFPVSPTMDGGKFFTIINGRRVATPLFIVLIVVESTDLVFALDSLPAVLAITQDGFVALTSNIFAILGLRSLYFALSGIMQLFRFLKVGLSAILIFIGVKMLIEYFQIHIGTTVSLSVIGGVLVTSVLASVLIKESPKSGHPGH
ncbi:MAG TPA: TerC family protein [Opitutaceae bacterium]|nr:TerC family protein [Opitutaceae bacterium]